MTDFDKRTLSTEIEHLDAGKRVDNWLTAKFTYHSRNQWQSMIKQGLITINDAGTKASRKLQCGDIVSFIQTKDEPPVDFDYSIAYEDDYLYIINKSGNLPCHPAGPFYKNTLWHHLKSLVGDIYMINRLDRETSGLMIIAKDKATAAKLSTMLKDNKITKKYIAFVHGEITRQIDATGYLCDDILSQVRKKRKFIKEELRQYSKEKEYSRTIITPLEYSSQISKVECTLETGRLHQIRATLCSLGHPMVGDKLYGLDDTMYLRLPTDELDKTDWKNLILERQALHAYHISFIHPHTGKPFTQETPLPKELNLSFINSLKR